jgi:anthranilate/para-aminobenzoate synthase component I
VPHIYSHERGEWITEPPPYDAAPGLPAEISHLEADAPRADFERAVKRTVEYIRAGDIFQANIAQRFSAQWRGCPRAIAAAAFEAAAPRYGAYMETPTHALASMSPELFLQTNAEGRIVTRPVKGTSSGNEQAAALAASEKDAAELHMIVDLMRNDLGRVCEAGSVRVDDPRSIESHATVHHGVAEVSGQLRSDATFGDVLRAAFPPGSVTGAPKVRAMQVIDELEPCARGPYCGAVGAIGADGMTLNVGIRTICMHRESADAVGGTLRYSAGCGIVADSDPAKEYEESLHKTAVMLHTAHALRPRK